MLGVLGTCWRWPPSSGTGSLAAVVCNRGRRAYDASAAAPKNANFPRSPKAFCPTLSNGFLSDPGEPGVRSMGLHSAFLSLRPTWYVDLTGHIVPLAIFKSIESCGKADNVRTGEFIHFSLILPGPQITWKWTMHTDKLTTKCHICLHTWKQGGLMCGIWDWQSTIVKDLNNSQDPKHTLFCRKNAFVAIYAFFSDSKCLLFTHLGGGRPKRKLSALFAFFLVWWLP